MMCRPRCPPIQPVAFAPARARRLRSARGCSPRSRLGARRPGRYGRAPGLRGCGTLPASRPSTPCHDDGCAWQLHRGQLAPSSFGRGKFPDSVTERPFAKHFLQKRKCNVITAAPLTHPSQGEPTAAAGQLYRTNTKWLDLSAILNLTIPLPLPPCDTF